MKRIYIKDVVSGSAAEEMEISSGDYLLSVNGVEINDILDYKFQIFDDFVTLEIEKPDGEVWDVEIEKEENEDIGLVFEEQLIDKPRNCANKCIFCFMDQLPPDVRETLIFKDDDFRLSFMAGNYVTFTNSGYRDLDRIINYHLSPINVSVHATDPDVRAKMLNNKNAGKILEYIKYLTDKDIQLNTQVVLCPGINDGEVLDKTIRELASFYPNVLSIAIVPVGLTKHREGLAKLEGFTKETAQKAIEQIEDWQKKFKAEFGSNIVFCADEFYIKAGLPIPEYERYEEFEQLEDGIGLLACFNYNFEEALKNEKARGINKTVSIATGKGAYEFIREKADRLEEKFDGLKINVYAIENHFFGPEITVTGLITGGDLIAGLKDKDLGEYLVLDTKMLKDDADVFLDNITLEEVEKALNIKAVKTDSLGCAFISAILGEK